MAPGQVYGFLGPNGAGKTTTIRMIMDLIRPTQGRVYVFGHEVRANHEVLRRRVGALVEGATFYDFMSGAQNLHVLALTGGNVVPGRIDRLLARVGLAGAAGRRVEEFSTGMKQRLGLAAALLHDPDLLILDEPTNGLDPAGIQQMRSFIRELVEAEGKTVFLSSHLLGEVEQICDRVAIINRGQIVQEGKVDDLLGTQTELRLEVTPVERALSLLRARWPVRNNGRWLAVTATRDEAPRVVAHLVTHDVHVFQVRVQQQSLEQFFLQVTGGK